MSTRIAPALGWRIRKAGIGIVRAGLPLSSARSSFRVRKRPPGLSIIGTGKSQWPATIGSTDDGRSRRAPGERLVQGLRLHLNLHRG